MFPRNEWHHVGSIGVHLEWKSRSVALVRVFEEPFGSIDPETKQPWQSWTWGCVAVKSGKTITICLAQTAPIISYLKAFKTIARKIGMRAFIWERWHDGRKFPVRFRL